jgi:hypothetical protein
MKKLFLFLLVIVIAAAGVLAQDDEELLALRAGCSGLSWNSDDEGMQPVIGPVEIPEGLYRLTATTEGYIIVQHEIIDGECDEDYALFAESDGDATDGAQRTFNSAGCEVLITIDNVTEPWTLAFEKLR